MDCLLVSASAQSNAPYVTNLHVRCNSPLYRNTMNRHLSYGRQSRHNEEALRTRLPSERGAAMETAQMLIRNSYATQRCAFYALAGREENERIFERRCLYILSPNLFHGFRFSRPNYMEADSRFFHGNRRFRTARHGTQPQPS
jgi:hypothetical protein